MSRLSFVIILCLIAATVIILFTSLFNGYVGTSTDISIKSAMSQLSLYADSYYATWGSYSDLCTNDPDFVKYLNEINNLSKQAATCMSLTTQQTNSSLCGSDQWAVISPLANQSGKWCVDSTGNKTLLQKLSTPSSCSCSL